MIKFCFTTFFLTFALISVKPQNPKGFFEECDKYLHNTVPFISSIQLDSTLRTDSIFLLDIRAKNEFDISHIKGAIWVGFRDFNNPSINNIPKEAQVIVYCSIGYRSEKIGEKLIANGYKNVKNLKGGIFNWANNNYYIVNNNGTTNVIHGYDQNWIKWLNTSVCTPVLQQ